MKSETNSRPFSDVIVIIDDRTWIWRNVHQVLEKNGYQHIRLSSSMQLRHNWARIKDARQIIIWWENSERRSGAIVEEILEIEPQYDVGNKILAVTTNPTREDVIYFNELGMRRVVRMRNREQDLAVVRKEIEQHLSVGGKATKLEEIWNRLQFEIDKMQKSHPDDAVLEKARGFLGQIVVDFPGERQSARYLDALACLEMMAGNYEVAEDYWKTAIEKNPAYYRSYKNITHLFIRTHKLEKALALLDKLQASNHENISRLVTMGDIKLKQHDLAKAEHFFRSALDRDSYCSHALNGLAEICFLQEKYDDARRLLARSYLAEEAAASLNAKGVQLVARGSYAEALEHYKKAQYVLPQHEKGPLLYYNIALCYYKWGKPHVSVEFLELALIKDPKYHRAHLLLQRIREKLPGGGMAEVA